MPEAPRKYKLLHTVRHPPHIRGNQLSKSNHETPCLCSFDQQLHTMVLERVRQILSHIAPVSSSQDQSTTFPYPGLSYHVGPTSPPLKTVTLGELLREQVQFNGDREALVSAWQGIRWTYKELDEKSGELARGFYELGIRKGDRMAIMAGNCGEYVLVGEVKGLS